MKVSFVENSGPRLNSRARARAARARRSGVLDPQHQNYSLLVVVDFWHAIEGHPHHQNDGWEGGTSGRRVPSFIRVPHRCGTVTGPTYLLLLHTPRFHPWGQLPMAGVG